MDCKTEMIYKKEIQTEDLSFDSPFYTELMFTISEELRKYEKRNYADKPEEIKRLDKEVSTSALGKYSLSDDEQKLYNEYYQKRMREDKVFYLKHYAESYIDDILYFRTVIARSYDKIKSQQSSEELKDLILDKKGSKSAELDPFILLATRTKSLQDFIEDYISHNDKMIEDGKVGREFAEQCMREVDDDENASNLIALYGKLILFGDLYYQNGKNFQFDFDTAKLSDEVNRNREFIHLNQSTLNKLVKPQHVALERSKFVSFTKFIQASGNAGKIKVDNKGTLIETSITTDEDHQGLRIDSFDTLVEEAIGALIDINIKIFEKNGYIDVPLSAIAQQVLILNPTAHISKEQGYTITESMNKLRHIFVKVDFRAQAIAHKRLNINPTEATIEDNALNYTKTTVNYKGNTIEVYRIHSYPPRYKYSKAVKQISGVPRDLLYLPNMNITKGVAILRRYLVEYIEGIKNSNLSKNIFFDTINKNCEGCFAYESKESKRDFRNKVTSILTGFKCNGYIIDFSIIKDGRSLKGIHIDVETESQCLPDGNN